MVCITEHSSSAAVTGALFPLGSKYEFPRSYHIPLRIAEVPGDEGRQERE